MIFKYCNFKIMEATLTQQQIESYRDNGFLLVENFLSDTELSFWREAVTQAIQAVSYTHLDVYKRQQCVGTTAGAMLFFSGSFKTGAHGTTNDFSAFAYASAHMYGFTETVFGAVMK